MPKIKKNRIDSDALLKKKALQGVKKPNPFEIQTNRSKFTILNRDTQSNRLARIPGAQSARAIEKRKLTLAQEYAQKNKSNRFTDQRKDGRNMDRNQIMLERKSMASRRKELFNLNDSVKLTHKGQTLEEIERFDDAVDNDDDSDEDGGQLDAEFMEAAHFGGGNEDGENRGKDRKTVIEEMIAESKRRKAEKQRENDEVYEMTQKLDQNWQSLISVVGDHMKGDQPRPQLDDYDKIMREMIFERRGQPAEKLKSQEELAKLEQVKLEKLERERLARMRGDDAEAKVNHRSADDLDDEYSLQLFNASEESLNNSANVDAEDGLYNPSNISQEAARDDNSEISNDDNDVSEDESKSESGDEDNLSDLKEDSVSESESEEELTNSVLEEQKLVKTNDISSQYSEGDASNVPFTFELPRTYEMLLELLTQHSPLEQSLVLERMINSNKANKPKLASLFAFLMQYLNDLFTDMNYITMPAAFKMLYNITPYLYDLAKINPAQTSSCFLEVLKEKVEEYHKRPKRYPPLHCLIFLKIVPIIFSATDFRHPVVTPSLVFISELLSRCHVKSRSDVTRGLFLVTVALECTERSNRFLPAALNFVNGILYTCFVKRSIHFVSVVPPFKSTPPFNNLLALDETTKTYCDNDFSLHFEDFVHTEINNSFKLRALRAALLLIRRVCKQLSDSPALHQISKDLIKSLELIDEDYLPSVLKVFHVETLNIVKTCHNKSLFYLMPPEKKPKPLRLLEPRIEAVYDDIQRRPKNQQQVDKQKHKKLRQKVKKEFRAAAREIRQDNEFIAKLQFKNRAASDRERKDRVKRIFADATTQQGELNSLDRKAKYKK